MEKIPEEANQLIELLLHFKSHMCSELIYRWMELPRKVRKLYSYSGAIRCQDDSDPKHYFCDKSQQHYFDPTNWVYALAMRMMLPQMMMGKTTSRNGGLEKVLVAVLRML